MRKIAIATVALSLAGFILGCSKARTDDSISSDIKAGMFSDPQTKSADINVSVQSGTVTLTGQVPDENTRYEAFKIAKQTAGVSNVNDQMTLPQSTLAAAQPSAPPVAAPERPSRRDRQPKRTESQDPIYRPLAGSNSESPYGSAADPQTSSPQSAAAQPQAAPVQNQPAPASAAPEPAPAPSVHNVSIPGGTPIHIQMIDSVDSSTAHVGDMFHASLASPITADGEPIVPAGTDIYVKLTNSNSAGRLTGRSELTLQLARLDFQGKSYNLVSDDHQEVGQSRGKRTAVGAGVGAAVGAALGGIFGGGKGAAIGAGAGGGAGTAGAAATGNPQVRIAPETKLDFTLQQPLELAYTPGKK